MVLFYCVFVPFSEASANALASFTKAPKSIALTADDTTEIIRTEDIDRWFSSHAKLEYLPSYRAEAESATICPQLFGFCDAFLSLRTRQSFHSATLFAPDENAISLFLNAFNTRFSLAPEDARFTVSEGKVSAFALGHNGRSIDTQAATALIANELKRNTGAVSLAISLPVLTIEPTVQSDDAQSLGIVELIGEGQTDFSGSSKSRIHNFNRALEQFQGVLIPPQKEFSFVSLLGEVDGEHGYLPELVIKNNKTEPEFGGGICQVSSTVFRAAIYSGLKITMRKNHAYPVHYYAPYGMDATIYIPSPDLRFVNNTPKHILIQSEIEGTKMFIRFYGTSDGRKTSVDGPHILERKPDGSMKTVFTQTVTDAQGNAFIKDDFRSNYASPSKYPHPGQAVVFTVKPADWSEKQWEVYRKSR